MIEMIRGNIISAPALGVINIIERGYLLLEDGIIRGVFDVLPQEYKSLPVTDYGDRLILQSFADMHMHAPQYVMMGMGMDLPLLGWLERYAFPLEARYADIAFARERYRDLAKALVEGGTTRVCLFSSLHTDATLILMEALENAGVTGYVGKVNMDRNGGLNLQETTEESKRETLRWLNACDRFRLIRPILTPRFTPSCTDELMAWLGALSLERHLPVQSHLSENTAEMAWVKELHPDCKQYWETYNKYGLFHDRTIMAHCIHCDIHERTALRDHNVFVAHAPDSNIALCSGFSPVRKMLDEGIHVVLGSDIAGGTILSMSQVIASAIRTSKVRRIISDWQEDFLTVEEAYYLATSAAAGFFGAGAGFAIGDALHAIVVDESRFPLPHRPLTLTERFERSIYLMQPSDIVACYSEGRRVK